jgi:dipeptidyl-peptidase-4
MRTLHLALAPLALIALDLPAPALAPAAEGKKLTLEQTAGRGGPDQRVSFRGSPPSFRWADDGEHLVTRRDGKDVWIDPLTGEEQPAPAPAEPGEAQEQSDTAARVEALVALGLEEDAARRLASGRRIARSAGGAARLYSSREKLYFHRLGEPARELPVSGEGQPELVDLSPDGRWAGYVAGNDLQLVDTASGATRAVTADGGPEMFNGKLDWVYQEEVYGRGDFKAFWWSPDSAHVAFLRLDESPVFDFTVIDHIAPDGSKRVVAEVENYPKAGDPNPIVSMGCVPAGGGDVVWLDLSRYPAEDEILIVRVGWTPTGDRVVFQVQDRIQTWLDLCYGDPRTGEIEVLLRETSPTWVNVLEKPDWQPDGTFLWQSERTGHRHLYHYRPDGELIAAVTQGEWDLWGVERVDFERGLVWFSGNKDGATGRNVYRVGLDGDGLVRLTQGRGTHSIDLNPDGSLFLDRWSSLSTPPGVRVCKGDGTVLRELGQAEIPALDEYATGAWELLQIPARDGYLLDAALLRPAGFDASKVYPVWLPTYSGPDSPSVSDRWDSSSWNQFLAQQGVLVLEVNVRTASRRGQEYIGQCYKQLGVQELADLEDALAWLTAHPWADAERVGITGWSYGGFMAGFALTHSKAFALGIAGAGVYDWRMYDTIYTERFMSTPQLNPEGYERASVIAAAKDLSGHLVLLHGTMDDNVHFQNTVQLVHALQDADQDFELMVYPESRHGVGAPSQRWHMRRLEWRAIREHLLDGVGG